MSFPDKDGWEPPPRKVPVRAVILLCLGGLGVVTLMSAILWKAWVILGPSPDPPVEAQNPNSFPDSLQHYSCILVKVQVSEHTVESKTCSLVCTNLGTSTPKAWAWGIPVDVSACEGNPITVTTLQVQP